MFGAVARAFRLLERGGVDPLAFIQAIIDNPTIRREMMDLVVLPEYPLKTNRPSLAGISYLLREALDWGALEHKLTRAELALLESYMGRTGYGYLTRDFDVRALVAIVQRFGLDGSNPVAREEVARRVKLSTSQIARIEDKLFTLIRREKIKVEYEFEGLTAIEDLRLTDRTHFCLRRASIATVEDLTLRTEEELLGITNFGVSSLDEVKTALAARGLVLAPTTGK
jgi:hypothetical protein